MASSISEQDLWFAGIKSVHIKQSDANVSQLLPKELTEFDIPELQRTIASLSNNSPKVSHFLSCPHSWSGQRNFPVLENRKGDQVAIYGIYKETVVPSYVVLPRFADNTAVALRILDAIKRSTPSLFPDLQQNAWLSSDEFLFDEERKIDTEIVSIKSQAETLIAQKENDKLLIADRFGFIRELLVATESAPDPNKRLSSIVRRSLEFLGFEVTDIDQKIKSLIKKEDYWAKDEGFLAIVEVSGTTYKNPKTKEFNDIFARIHSIYKRKGELLPDTKDFSGLLVLGYDVSTHPKSRPKMYTGEHEHLAETAAENNIGLLSTVVLHEILVKVKDGTLSKNEARNILKTSGRIEIE